MSVDHTYQVAVYLRGESLNPEDVTAELKISPSVSQFKGESKVTSTNHSYKTKIGVWALKCESVTSDLSPSIKEVIDAFKQRSTSLMLIKNVEEAYLDIFISAEAERQADTSYGIEIDSFSVSRIEKLGLSLKVTIAVVR